ncbi:hypothetical protein FQZ97_1102800 [compost metagenome]
MFPQSRQFVGRCEDGNGLAISHCERGFRCSEHEVERIYHRPDLENRVVGDNPFGAVRRVKRHDVSTLYSHRFQIRSYSRGHQIDLGERQSPPFKNDRGFVPESFCSLGHQGAN